MNKGEYLQRIKYIYRFLSGNFKGLKRQLARDMKAASAAERFEEAAQLRRQIHALEHIRDVSLIKDENRVSSGGPSTSLRVNVRIEAFDVAHTSGTETVAVMTVIDNGETLKSMYRKFRIHS